MAITLLTLSNQMRDIIKRLDRIENNMATKSDVSDIKDLVAENQIEITNFGRIFQSEIKQLKSSVSSLDSEGAKKLYFL